MKLILKPSLARAQNQLAKTGYNLMSHQIKGVNWLLKRESAEKPKGGILADDMGLGKTIQTISCILGNPKKKTLIVVPANLVNQWESEFRKFVPDLPLYIHWRNQVVGEEQFEEMETQPVNVILTTYGYVKSTFAQTNKFDRIVCDEAHYFRNPGSKTFKFIQLISAPIRWALTGTPIQNYLMDLQTLLSYVGLTQFGWGRKMSIEDAQELIPIYVLRRTKSDAKIELPKPKFNTIGIKFSNKIEDEFYQKVRENTLHHKHSIGGNPLVQILRMRQSTCVSSSLAKKFARKHNINLGVFGNMVSTKLNFIAKKIDAQTKSVVFCYFKAEIDYLAQKLAERQIKYGVISGDVPMDERKQVVTDDTLSVLLIQIHAGGTGLNLQHYKQIYISSPHWNPSLEEQAIGRLYRIGQDDSVVVNRIIMMRIDEKPTIDKRIQEVQQEKHELIDTLLS